MKLWKRRIFLIAAFALFLIMAPVLVFYAIGYRYDYKNNSFRKIGMIIIESKPNNADIFLNDQYIDHSPKRIKNLVPDEYEVKVEKENYKAWEKRLSVESKKVTWASNIKLFFKNPEIFFLPSMETDYFSISPNKKNIVGILNNSKSFGLWLTDPKSEETTRIFPISADSYPITSNEFKNLSISDINWSPNSKQIFFTLSNKQNKTKRLILLDIENQNEIISLNNSFNFKVENLQWNSNSDTVYFLNKGSLYFIDINTKTLSKPIIKDVLDYDLGTNNILYTTKDKDEILLAETSKNVSEKNIIMHLPKDEKYTFEFGKDNNIAILFNNKKKLYLINGNDNTPKLINENTNEFKWSDSKNKLLYFSDNEAWFLAPKEKSDDVFSGYKFNESNLLTRYSAEIKDASWYPDEEYIALSLQDSVKIIELDGRGKKNTFELSKELAPLNYHIEFDKKGEYLYMIDKKTKKLLKIKITDI